MKIELPHEHGDSRLENFITKEMPEKENFQVVADVFKLLDDPSRLQIFWTLCHIEECVINLAVILGISSPALSHHLKILKTGGIIVSRRDGKEVYYKAADTEEVRAMHHALEQIMMIACPEQQTAACRNHTDSNGKLSEQELIIQNVHEYLATHLNKRITIEELSRKYLINSTTLKQEFKKMYGTSIAAHIKEHRMEKAAELLIETDASISEIAGAVGFASQSKFSTAFSEFFGALPLEYRKRKLALQNKNFPIN